jgi:hypothetical protein
MLGINLLMRLCCHEIMCGRRLLVEMGGLDKTV